MDRLSSRCITTASAWIAAVPCIASLAHAPASLAAQHRSARPGGAGVFRGPDPSQGSR